MLLIDTYNVLHTTGVLPPALAGVGPSGLLRMVAASRMGRDGARLVCDGPPTVQDADGGRNGAVRIVFAGAGKDADSLIEKLLERSSAPRRMTVVSSDRRLRQAARRRRARWLSSEAFLRRLGAELDGPAPAPPARKPDVPLSQGEIDHWLRQFGMEDVVGTARSVRPAPPKGRPTEQSKPAGKTRPPAISSEPPPLEHDPFIEEALREWSGRLRADDLDMSKWLAPPESDRSSG